MHEGTAKDSDARGIGSWIMMMLGTVVFLYVLSFAVLALYPPAARAAQTIGLSKSALEKIYYPILWFLR